MFFNLHALFPVVSVVVEYVAPSFMQADTVDVLNYVFLISENVSILYSFGRAHLLLSLAKEIKCFVFD